ncbi:rhamnogalacturonan acetylesterase [Niabella yanshanensis]|uniref:Rhamnogalacturonan acetylesterase n=2 Tax=Niabella yanshanensis TaxID=577386 RepID=A0ABZ0W4E8_9BACT|nr:rhamnogalacturonan acetylesterase [Niabella yanshanensis]
MKTKIYIFSPLRRKPAVKITGIVIGNDAGDICGCYNGLWLKKNYISNTSTLNESFKIIDMKRLFIALGCLFFLYSFTKTKKVTIYSIGDSTMCDYDQRYLNGFGGDNYPIRGWMQMMPQFFNGQVIIKNMARSGRSSKSFREEGYWQKTIDQVMPGDYVFIMFGPNDEKDDSLRHTDPHGTYRQNLINYISETREKKAIPVLFTSITRRKFDKSGTLLPNSFEAYVEEVRKLSKEMKVPLIDLNLKSRGLVQQLGPEASKQLYVYIEPGKFTKLPKGKKDDTHLSEAGATAIAKLAGEGLREMKSPLAQYLVK